MGQLRTPPAYLVDADGNLAEVDAPIQRALGTGKPDRDFETTQRQLHPGERLILVTVGITERRIDGGGTLGVDGLRRAVERAENPTAAATALAIQDAVTNCWREPLEDDAAVVVMAVA
jgi:serine phosphatase RsbU (regulator of sigma subunit)